jgi:hypothetical protein
MLRTAQARLRGDLLDAIVLKHGWRRIYRGFRVERPSITRFFPQPGR